MKDGFASVISSWPRPAIRNFADDLGVPYGTAQQWKFRDSIPDEYWDLVVVAAARRGIGGVTLESLQAVSARKRRAAGNGHSVAA